MAETRIPPAQLKDAPINTVLAGPASGSAGPITARALVTADLPAGGGGGGGGYPIYKVFSDVDVTVNPLSSITLIDSMTLSFVLAADSDVRITATCSYHRISGDGIVFWITDGSGADFLTGGSSSNAYQVISGADVHDFGSNANKDGLAHFTAFAHLVAGSYTIKAYASPQGNTDSTTFKQRGILVEVVTSGGGDGGAPTTAKYLTTATDGTLSAEVVIPGLVSSPDIAGAAGAGTADEFDSGTDPFTWAPSAPSTHDSNATIPSHYYFQSTDTTTRIGTKSWVPGSGAWDARIKLEMGVEDGASGSDHEIGFLINDSGDSNRVLVVLRAAGLGYDLRMFTYASGTFTQRGSTWALGGRSECYLRLTRDGSNNVSAYYSTGGRLWQLIATQAFAFTVGGLGFYASSGQSSAYAAAVDWLRTSV